MKKLVIGILLLAATASAQTIYHVGDAGVVKPTLVNMPRPRYTDEAWAARIEGIVTVQAVIRSDGSVSDPHVTKSLDAKFGLDENAVDVVKHVEFKSGSKDGTSVDVQIDVQVEYTLRRRE